MKKFTLLTALFISSLLIALQSSAQEGSGGFLIIKTYESTNMNFNKIVVTEKGKKIEEFELSRASSANALEPNQILINNILDKYKSKGYKLIYLTSGSHIVGAPIDVMYTTYIFEL